MSQGQSFSLWPDLLPELNGYIFSLLDDNDIACSLRPVNKATAEKFKQGIVHLSRPVLPEVYYKHWARPDSTRELSLKARRKLLCLTAASGIIANLELAIAVAGCLPTCQAFQAAAKAGHLHVCRWLHERRCPNVGALPAAAGAGHLAVCRGLLEMEPPGYDISVYEAVAAAAEGGHLHVLEWLLGLADPDQQERVAKGIPNIATSAARGGHMEVVAWMAEAHPDKLHQWRLGTELLVAAAQGCDLATLQRLHPGQGAGPALLPPALQQQHEELAADMHIEGQKWVMPTAAESPTPDWRAKVEWLKERGYRLSKHAYCWAADCPDGLERLEWLAQWGGPPVDSAIYARAAEAAARDGNLAALQSLSASGCRYHEKYAAQAAAEHGHMDVVMWLVETVPDVVSVVDLVGSAAESGNLQLLEWLSKRGEPWEGDPDRLDRAFRSIMGTGNMAAIELVVTKEKPCRLPQSHVFWEQLERHGGNPFAERIDAGDLSTLRCLRRLGIVRRWPFSFAFERVYEDALKLYDVEAWRWGGTTAFRWLLELGCPVDWCRAEAVVRAHGGQDGASLLALLAEWRQRRHLEGGEVEVESDDEDEDEEEDG